MSFSKVYSAQATVLDATIITIEVDLSGGFYAFSVVGLPDKAVEESRDRVSAAVKNSGFASPKQQNQKTVISLAPADLKKEGPMFDLGIALAYLLASKQVRFNPEKKLFLGELSLDGELRGVRGVLPLVREAKAKGFTQVYVPEENAHEAALIDGIAIYAADTLADVVSHLNMAQQDGETPIRLEPHTQTSIEYRVPQSLVDLSDIRGQETAKRALEIAASGGHNILLYGPPGTGKTMLAKAFCALLPGLSFDDILEVTSIHSVSGQLDSNLVTHPPFRAPHHTSSYVAMVGGGSSPRPGEITLAHRGVLFLDEFPEFDRRVIESLRQPLEDGVVSVSRAKGSATFPARATVVAAMNPCPCGNWGNTTKRCTCTPAALQRYQRKLSGPIVDRFDLWVEVAAVDHDKLSGEQRGEGTEASRERVAAARHVQEKRFSEHTHLRTNSTMGVKELEQFAPLERETKTLLTESAKKLGLSARGFHRTLKLARTIADLDRSEHIHEPHILEALQYRPKTFM